MSRHCVRRPPVDPDFARLQIGESTSSRDTPNDGRAAQGADAERTSAPGCHAVEPSYRTPIRPSHRRDYQTAQMGRYLVALADVPAGY
jgi:hypothetical protein